MNQLVQFLFTYDHIFEALVMMTHRRATKIEEKSLQITKDNKNSIYSELLSIISKIHDSVKFFLTAIFFLNGDPASGLYSSSSSISE